MTTRSGKRYAKELDCEPLFDGAKCKGGRFRELCGNWNIYQCNCSYPCNMSKLLFAGCLWCVANRSGLAYFSDLDRCPHHVLPVYIVKERSSRE